MKIVYLANAGSVHFIRWYKYFLNNKHDIILISGNDRLLAFKLNLPGVKVHYIPEIKYNNHIINFILNIFLIPAQYIHLKRILRQFKPDIVHAHQLYPYGFWMSWFPNKNTILTPIGSDIVIYAKKYFVYRVITKYVLNRVKVLTGDSLVLRDSCRPFNKKLQYNLVQNGVDLQVFNDDNIVHYRKTIRDQYKLESNTILIFYARGFTKLYNVESIIKSIPLIIKDYPNVKLLLSHHFGNESDKYIQLVKKLGIEEYVFFTGLIDHKNIYKYYKASDIFISVPSSDNSPSSVYEAMACNIPTIISNLKWTKYAMRHKVNTYVINNISPPDISSAFKQLQQNDMLRKSIVNNGQKTVKKYFSYDKNMLRMETIMEKLLN